VYGLDDKTVIWTASAGYFVEDLYHAPGTAVDEVTITATSVQNNLVKGTATITVGDCACSWSANVTGEIAGIYDGSFATWTDEFLSYVTLTMDIDGGAPAFSFGPDFVITAPGTYMGLATAIMSEGGPVYGSNEDVTIIIETIDDKVLTGRMSGQLSTPLTQEPWELFIDVDLEFIAQHQTRGGACQ